ncbi:hypothetical protein [Arthrobacter sp. H20]|uniref:hypothetical protein n=1 Tax=Arthrobacter sp. H20 TaxID=1267981 RepID=UPI00047E58FC|nr:hypothetical protein [Arthrobacter sp. H20]
MISNHTPAATQEPSMYREHVRAYGSQVEAAAVFLDMSHSAVDEYENHAFKQSLLKALALGQQAQVHATLAQADATQAVADAIRAAALTP